MLTKGTIALFCAFVAVVGASSPWKAFRSGHEYSYEFDSQLASSLTNGEQFSATRMRAIVKLNFLSDKNVLVQIERPQLGQWNDHFAEPSEMHKFDKFQRVEIKERNLEKLSLPFMMRLTNGKLQFSADDSVESENIKRAIVNTLQVQLENSLDESNKTPKSASGYAFRLNETTIEGDCESLYDVIIVKDSQEAESNVYNVTKSINFANCRQRPEFRYNYQRYSEPMKLMANQMDSEASQMPAQQNNAINVRSNYEFTVAGDKRQFIIQYGKVQSSYMYELLDSKHVSMVTYVVSQMVLKNVEPKTAQPLTIPMKPEQTLVYNDEYSIARERFIAEGDESLFNFRQNSMTETMVTPIKNTLTRLAEAARANQLDEHVARYFSQLVQLLRRSRKTELANVHDDLYAEGDQLTKDLLVDAIATAGTKNSLDLLFQMIAKKELTTSKAASAVSKLVNLPLVSNDMLNAFEKLMKTSAVTSNAHLHRTCKLVYGGMISAMCRAENPATDADKWVQKKYCPASVAAELAEKLIKDFKKASTRAEKVLAIKVIGNAGLEGCQKYLQTVINDWNVEKIIRIQAIDALRLMRSPNSNAIANILLPVYLNNAEYPEIRMNAFYQLIKAYPTQAVLDAVMASLTSEQNAHVKAFAIKMIDEVITESKFMYPATVAEKFQSIKKQLNMNNDLDMNAASTFFSMLSTTPLNLREIAAQLQTAMVFGNESRLPSEFMATINTLTQGRLQSDAWQFGFHAQDLEQLLQKVSSVLNGKSIDDLIVREQRSSAFEVDALGMMKSLFKKMQIVARRTFSHEATPVLLFYSRWHGIDLSFCLTDEESLPSMFQNVAINGKFDVSMIEIAVPMSLASHSAGFFTESVVKVPTTFGVPLIVRTQIPTVSIVSGNMNVKFDSSETHIKKAIISVKTLPKVAITVITKMNAISRFFVSGVQNLYSAQLGLPTDLKVTVAAPYWLPVVEIALPEAEIRPIHFQSRPVTFTLVWPEKSNIYVEAVEKTLIVNDELQTSKVRTIEPFTGLRVNYDAHYHPNAESDNYDWLLSGENSLELWLQSTAHTSKTLKFALESVVKSTFSESAINVPEFDELFGRYQKDLFAAVTDNEELIQIKSEVRNAMQKMSKISQIVFKASTSSNVASLDLKYVCDAKNVLCVINADANVNEDWKYRSIIQFARPILRSLAGGVPTEHFLATMESGFGKQNNVVFSFYGRPMEAEIKKTRELVDFESMKAPKLIPAKDFSLITEVKKADLTNQSWKKMMERLFNVASMLPGFDGYNAMTEEEMPMKVVALRLNPSNFSIQFPGQGETRLQLTSAKQSLYDLLETAPNAECAIRKGTFIKSFDGSNYKIPLTTCYTILAQDCGNPEEPRYSFMVKKMRNDQEHLKVKMLTSSNHIYEMYQESGKMVVKVDGFILRESEYAKYNINKIGNSQTYELHCAYANAGFRFNGEADLTLMIGEEYVGKQCGVCGHYNMDASDDLRDNANEQASNLKEFHASYLYRGDESCDPAAINAMETAEYGYESEQLESVETDLIQKTMTIETHSKVCFSKRTVPACPKGTKAGATVPRKVEFVCRPRSDYEARKMLRQLKRNADGIIRVEGNSNHAKAVKVPSMCEVLAF
uniref:Vitellogenin domain-containing protein n=1 Tax=Panagrellus redivivus TaxID=6233 RepID=A0A7E4V4P0_PANRE